MNAQAGLPAIGDKLGGRFRVVFGRGSGPCGIVFKALDLALDLPVAVKVFRPELFASEFRDQNLMRLYRARAYQDANIVKIYEVQEDRGLQFITCQLMEGMSLQAVLDLHAESGEHFTVPKIRSFCTRMLTGLQAIHKTGAIHGNLKPQNIFVLPDRLALSDPYYLVSRLLREGEEIPVADYYRGPEQLTDPALELRETDVYSLALIAGEVIGGVPVKPGIPLSQQVPRLTPRFDDVFLKATDPEPSRRQHRLDEFGDALVDVLGKVESEGLWVRRYHETGSFKAIRVPRADAVLEPVQMVATATASAPVPVPVPAPAAAPAPEPVPVVAAPVPAPKPEPGPVV
ncbi:MAG: protein kinase, partial [Deltaproteobacteria bacterium]|nr:protein kinase [Deltaproteobacteria bacterium]